ncbi:MAG: LPS export ABC transporter periplasmic protein LptC [Burkholderiales bacterium]|nr:LPS export ABC transporter periplasmic protein LptC [Burkholderiales bacterium]
MMSDRLALAFPVFVVALLTALSFWLDAVVRTAPPLDKDVRHDPDFIVDNFVATQTGLDGLLQHTLRATRMSHFLHDDSTLLENPRLIHYTEKRLEVTATSDRALMSSDGEVIQMSGNVRLTRAAVADQSELVLLTDSLVVTPDKGSARTDQPVVIRNATSRTDAVGLEFDYRLRQLELLRDVRTTWQRSPAASP